MSDSTRDMAGEVREKGWSAIQFTGRGRRRRAFTRLRKSPTARRSWLRLSVSVSRATGLAASRTPDKSLGESVIVGGLASFCTVPAYSVQHRVWGLVQPGSSRQAKRSAPTGKVRLGLPFSSPRGSWSSHGARPVSPLSRSRQSSYQVSLWDFGGCNVSRAVPSGASPLRICPPQVRGQLAHPERLDELESFSLSGRGIRKGLESDLTNKDPTRLFRT